MFYTNPIKIIISRQSLWEYFHKTFSLDVTRFVCLEILYRNFIAFNLKYKNYIFEIREIISLNMS